MATEKVTVEFSPERSITIETGKMALLAGGAITIRQGDTVLLVAACSSEPRPGVDFFPLQVDYRERFSAAGRFPGGYFKREGRPSEKEILTARMTDRPLRPLFPKGFKDDTQIMATLLSADGINEADVLCMLGASAALMVSDIPFDGPVGALRVGRIDGKFIANPTHQEIANSDIDLVYAGVAGKTIMIEGSANQVSEEDLRDAMLFADEIVGRMVAAQKDLASRANKEKRASAYDLVPEDLQTAVDRFCANRLENACLVPDKAARQRALDEVYQALVEALTPTFVNEGEEAPKFKAAFEATTEATVRRLILDDGKRMDGRAADELRPIECEVGLLPRTHGSALFNRGETQALVSTTLGAEGDAQEFDAITGGIAKKRFFLHYNFPNFSVGETGRIAGPGRREIGHGALAERSLEPVVPEDFNYSIRCVSDILGSNGSSSMASVCGGSLALMDAGVPVEAAVAGISIGLVKAEDGRKVFLTDILGAEDHYGDMDFKMASTRRGVTGFQLDLKIAGLEIDAMYEAMLKSKAARAQILDIMANCIAEPRKQMSRYAPQVLSLHINPEKIGALIGPGGKVIRQITESTGTQIDILDDGTVNIFAIDKDSMDRAERQVMEVAAEPEIGRIYQGIVRTVKDFGAFVEIMPGIDGLLHISELADFRVKNVQEICNVGDTVAVKVIDIDERGRVRLSRRAALAEEETESK